MFSEFIEKFSEIVLRYDESLGFRVFTSVLLLALFSLFTWFFYKSTAKRNIIKLELNKYNKSSHPIFKKFCAMLFNFVEYVLIIPFLLLVWYAALSIVILIVAEQRRIEEVLFLSAGLIGAIRILAYIKDEIAQDLAKLFPLAALTIFVLSPGSFKLETVLNQVREIPLLFSHIFSFVIVVLAIEIFLRAIYSVFELWVSKDETPT